MKPFLKKKSEAGFTLMEVIMAMAIMALAFSAILTTQSSSILTSMKIRNMNLAGMLAKNLMAESEHLMEGKNFSELKEEEKGDYPEPFALFKWKREVKEVKFPDFGIFTAPSGDSNGGADQQSADDKARGIGQSVTKYLSENIRELIVTVSWKQGEGDINVSLTTYLINTEAQFNFSL